MSGRRSALAGALAAIAIAAGCADSGLSRIAVHAVPVVTAPAVTATTTAAAPSASSSASVTAPPQTGSLTWHACGSLQCSALAVPLDYANARGGTISLALARRPALDPAHRIGSIIINPGGPGDSGVDDLPAELRILTSGLQRRFDIVSFDPRGVARSAPVHCGGSSATPAPLPDPVPPDDAGAQRLVQESRDYAADCNKASGTVLPFVGTVDVARDLDRIRIALGDSALTYIGHSYGTLLGAVYADEFPSNVRALVLDGALDPALSTDELSLAQAKGFEASLAAFAQWCGSNSCGWHAAADPRTTVLDLVQQVRQTPMAAGSRKLGPGEAYLGVLGGLYAQSYWPGLGRALAATQRGDGAPLLALSDRYLNHGGSNAVDANSAVTCLDHPVSTDTSTYRATADAAGQQAPLFGPLFAWGGLGCAVWPARPTLQPHRIAGPATPIVVVGTTGDPATPYQWAVNLAGELAGGVLLTRRGVDHVAYYYSACVRAAVERYLVDLAPPAAGTTC
jgi:pimeloyl-ACP methyl ester carboxylesterase